MLAILVASTSVSADPRSAPVTSQPHKAPIGNTRGRPMDMQPRRTATPVSVLVQYQRTGRELFKLQDLRGHLGCAELWQRFRAIPISSAITTAQGRVAALEALADLAVRIQRMRRVEISSECLRNPLADGCR